MSQNKSQELEHAKKILHNPEFYWNSSTSAGYRGSVRRANWVMDAAKFKPNQKILEVGCGTGFFSELFINVHPDIQLHGIDISSDLLAKAKERCGTRGEFLVADIETLPYEADFFDAVVGVRVLHHLDLEASFREIRRVLKSKGVIAFCEPNMLNPQIMIQKNIPFIKKIMGDTPDETAFFRWPLKRFLVRQGFEKISVEPFDFLHPWIPEKMVPVAEKIGYSLEKLPGLGEIAGSLRIFAQKI